MSKPDHHSEYKRLSVSTKYNLYCIRFGKKENDFKNESIILPYLVHESNPIWVLKHGMGYKISFDLYLGKWNYKNVCSVVTAQLHMQPYK